MNTFSSLSPGKAWRIESGVGTDDQRGKVMCSAGEVMVVNLTSAYAPQLPNGLPDPHASVLENTCFIVSRLAREKLKQKMPVELDGWTPENVCCAVGTQASARPVVSRAFHLAEGMTNLTIVDSIDWRASSLDNVTFGIHTRAASVVLQGDHQTLPLVIASCTGGLVLTLTNILCGRACGCDIAGSSAILVAPERGLRLRLEMHSDPPGACSDWHTAVVDLPNGTLHNQTRFPLYGARKVWSVCERGVAEMRVKLSGLRTVKRW